MLTQYEFFLTFADGHVQHRFISVDESVHSQDEVLESLKNVPGVVAIDLFQPD